MSCDENCLKTLNTAEKTDKNITIPKNIVKNYPQKSRKNPAKSRKNPQNPANSKMTYFVYCNSSYGSVFSAVFVNNWRQDGLLTVNKCHFVRDFVDSSM